VGQAVVRADTPRGTASLTSLSVAQLLATVLLKDHSPPPAPQHRERVRFSDISTKSSLGTAFRTLRGEL